VDEVDPGRATAIRVGSYTAEIHQWDPIADHRHGAGDRLSLIKARTNRPGRSTLPLRA
jgi:hypothetical protein